MGFHPVFCFFRWPLPLGRVCGVSHARGFVFLENARIRCTAENACAASGRHILHRRQRPSENPGFQVGRAFVPDVFELAGIVQSGINARPTNCRWRTIRRVWRKPRTRLRFGSASAIFATARGRLKTVKRVFRRPLVQYRRRVVSRRRILCIRCALRRF